MNKLYLTALDDKTVIGYVILNGMALKLFEGVSEENVKKKAQKKGFTNFEWRIPHFPKYQIIKVKKWQ